MPLPQVAVGFEVTDDHTCLEQAGAAGSVPVRRVRVRSSQSVRAGNVASVMSRAGILVSLRRAVSPKAPPV